VSLPEYYIQEDNELKYAQKGDILTGRVGSIGSFALYDIEDNFAFSDNVLRIKCIAAISNLYLTTILNSILVKIQIDRSKKGSLQNVINQMTLNDLRIPLPPLEIRNKIADEVKKRISEAERLKAEVSKIVEEAKKQVEGMILGN
jgi:restriction endonuclease S subunit